MKSRHNIIATVRPAQRGDDAGEFVMLEAEQFLVAGYQELDLSEFGEGKKVIVVRMGGAVDLR